MINGIRLHAALALALMGVAGAGTRVFTDTKGREINAEIYMMNGASVILTRGDGKRFQLPVSTLSEADRSFIAEWAKGLPRVKLDWRFRAEEGKLWGVGDVESNNWSYEIEIRNQGKINLSGLSLRCNTYKTSSGRHPGVVKGQRYLGPHTKTIELPAMLAGKSVKVRSPNVAVKRHKPLQTADSRLGSSGDWSERIAGIRVEVMHGEKVIAVKDYGQLP